MVNHPAFLKSWIFGALALIVISGPAFAEPDVKESKSVPSGSPVPVATSARLPSGPLLNPIPDATKWTITHKAPAAKATSKSRKSKRKIKPSYVITGERTGDISHIVTTYLNGNKTEIWRKGDVQSVMNAGWTTPIITPADEDDLDDDFSWISARNFEGVEKIDEKECMTFHDTILPKEMQHAVGAMAQAADSRATPAQNIPQAFGTPIPSSAPVMDEESLKVKAVATIELKRRLPVSLKLDDEVTTYEFESLPKGTVLTLPSEVQAAMAAQAAKIDATTRKEVSP